MKIKSLLIGIFCLIPVSGMAVTVDPPHGGSTSGFTCATCHTAHADLGGIGYELYHQNFTRLLTTGAVLTLLLLPKLYRH